MGLLVFETVERRIIDNVAVKISKLERPSLTGSEMSL